MKILAAFICFCFLPHIAALPAYPANPGERPSAAAGEKLYGWYCAPCHGMNGDGRGYNAKNLDPRPANHTDAEFMGGKTDSELYKAVSGGGKAAGRSTLMPPWGGTIADPGIRSLVMYMRKLCGCR